VINFLKGLNDSTTKPIPAEDKSQFDSEMLSRIKEGIVNGSVEVARVRTDSVLDSRRICYGLIIGDVKLEIVRTQYSIYDRESDARYSSSPSSLTATECANLFSFIFKVEEQKRERESIIAKAASESAYQRDRDKLISQVYALPCRSTGVECTPEAAEIFKKRFSVLVDAVKNDDLSQASFPLLGSEARLQLQTQCNTLQWVLEMLNIKEED